MTQIKWYNITEYVTEDGEILDKPLNKKKYRIVDHEIKQEFKKENNYTYGINKRTNLCREHEQLELEL